MSGLRSPQLWQRSVELLVANSPMKPNRTTEMRLLNWFKNWLRNWFKKPQPEPVWGLVEQKLQPGEVYRAIGKFKQLSSYEHELSCTAIKWFDATDIPAPSRLLNECCLQHIFSTEESQTLRGAAAVVFGSNQSNYRIRFTARPAVGDIQVLIDSPVYIKFPGYTSSGLAQTICQQMAAIAQREAGKLYPMLAVDGFAACNWWHGTIVRLYLLAINQDWRVN